jgi:hypothetical protein
MQTSAHTGSRQRYLRTLLVLGRASNVPTVWSNCLAAWLLGGGGPLKDFVLLALGATFLYVGGMYLNDAFDAEFDRQHRPERPIPSHAITLAEVWGFGIGWLLLGFVLLALFGWSTLLLSLLLIGSILIYDAVHKVFILSPVLMALCRFFLFLAASSAGAEGVTGLALWTALALACYIIGLSYVAKSESTRGVLRYWPCYLLGAPVLLAYVINAGMYKSMSIMLSFIVLIWIVRSLWFTFWSPEKNIGRTVSGLLAGIVLVDLLALAGGTPMITILMFALFGSALLFQRFIPAT